MNAHNPNHKAFTGMARAAAAMNAEDAFERCSALLKTTEPATLAGRTAFESRIFSLSYHDKKSERHARDQAIADLHRPSVEEVRRDEADMLAIDAGRRELMRSGPNDPSGIDHHAAGHSHDGAGFRIL